MFRPFRYFFSRRWRRLLRRGAHRLVPLSVVLLWIVPLFQQWAYYRVIQPPNGRITDLGRLDVPLLNTAVVFVPDPETPVDLLRYASPLRNLDVEPLLAPRDAAHWLWTDPAGGFHSYIVARGLPYRVVVRRAGCEPVSVGSWTAPTGFAALVAPPVEWVVPPCRRAAEDPS